MAKLTIDTLQSGFRSVESLNSNFTEIETALENTLSRDGTSPNQMEAAIDMNSNRIINLPAPASSAEPARLQDVTDNIEVIASTVLPTKADTDFGNVTPLVGREGLGFTGTNTQLGWGSYFLPTPDTVTDAQLAVVQLQSTFSATGSLGAVYGQRVAGYTGGAVNDATTPATAAVRGYTQVGQGVTFCNEMAGLFVCDNYSYQGQGSGVFGQGLSREGGRAWGILGEAKEYHKTFTATAGQTVFTIPNGYVANKCSVVKNNVLLTRTTDFVDSNGTTVVLTTGATAGDTIKVFRGDPVYAIQACEFGVFAGAGSDVSNNRNGVNIFGYRFDTNTAIPTNIGSLLKLITDPADASLTVDVGLQYQGKFGIGIDFTHTSASFTDYMIKFNTSGAGVSELGNVAIGDQVPLDTAGYATLRLRKATNGALVELGDNTVLGRIQASTGSGIIFGSDTNTDVVFTRNGSERARLSSTGLTLSSTVAQNYASDALAAAGGVPLGGLYHNAGAARIRIV
jgi:hypothetical protein